MATASTEDIKKIVNGFLLNAPPGEFHEVVTDVRNLLNNDALLNEIATDTFREYNTQQMLVVDSGNGSHKCLIAKAGEASPSEYLDPSGGHVVTFDHFKQEVTGTRNIAGELDSDAEPWRSAVQNKVDDYVKNHYDHGAGAVYSSKQGSSTIIITICISSSIYSGTNFYNGRWRSVWTVKISGSKAEMEGNIRVQVHYYEDGNVQLNTNITKKKDGLSAKDPTSVAEAVIKAIFDIETDFQNNLDINYDKMNSTTFKSLRRQLPVFATRINWPKISQYTIGGDLQKKT